MIFVIVAIVIIAIFCQLSVLPCFLLLGAIFLTLAEIDQRFDFNEHPAYTHEYGFTFIFVSAYNTVLRIVFSTDKRQYRKWILPNELFPEAEILENQWEIIRDEALAAHSKLVSFNSFDVVYTRLLQSNPDQWKTLVFKWYSDKYFNEDLCPKTVSLIKSIPNIKAAMISVLEPGAWIPPHRGPYCGSIRYHLGLVVPENCFIKVNNEDYYWRDGEGVLFDDTYTHEVKNNSDKRRFILFLDVLRPLPFFNYFHRKLNNSISTCQAITDFNKNAEKIYNS
jgi:beta-hydroxylase